MWYYKINPVISEDVNSEYVKNTMSKIFTCSKESEVCWNIDSENITFSSSGSSKDVKIEEPDELLYIDFDPFDADEIPTEDFYVTVVAIAEATRKGVYKIPVQISTDGGATWTAEKVITFDTSDFTDESNENRTNISGSSNSGCNSGVAACSFGLALMALMLKRKAS